MGLRDIFREEYTKARDEAREIGKHEREEMTRSVARALGKPREFFAGLRAKADENRLKQMKEANNYAPTNGEPIQAIDGTRKVGSFMIPPINKR